ncbi:MAG TPA: Flp pilus assembly protein CpaB [Oligoflexia bacterium]|nr:Flp pilus assembly protein CpaB [Oligoflexia bacterium]HMP48279.1 Flp pilus assembly protein CpaB [Oligoflexia bacterium]
MSTKKISKPKKLNSSGRTKYIPWAIAGISVFASLLFAGLRFQVDTVPANASQDTIEPQMVELEVPSRPVSRGEQLKSVPFAKVKWPNSPDMMRFVRQAAEFKDYYANAPLSSFSPVSIASLTKSSSEANAVVEGIPQGFRAITVKVDIESAVEGWAQTGAYVDVILMRQSLDSELGIEAKVIAENVKILSAGASVDNSSNNSKSTQAPATVTLLVSQEDALKVRTASTIGKLTFALRGLGDQSPTLATNMNQKVLLGGSRTLQVSGKRDGFKGVAKDSDGTQYILDADARWVKEADIDKKNGNGQ